MLSLIAGTSVLSRVAVAQEPFVPPPAEVFEETPDDALPAQAELQARIDQLLNRIESLELSESKRLSAEAEKKASASKLPIVNFSQELQLDAYTFNQDAESKAAYGDIENGTAFRRARIALKGNYGPSEYRIEVDFAQPGRPSFLDVYGGFHDLPYLGRVRVGHFFEPFLLDRLTSNRYQIFMERSMVDQAFAPSRHSGVAAQNTFNHERGTWAFGIFRPDNDAFGDDVQDNFDTAFTGRVSYLPYYDEMNDGSRLFHVGFAFSARGTQNHAVRFRAQPEARLGAATPNVPRFVDTGFIPADSYELLGFETAWVNGPFSIQSEYVMTPVNTLSSGTVIMNGWYAFASYFLTGEHRPYRKGSGTFGRIHPHRDFLRYRGQPENKCVEFGPGAWEIAMRVSQLDLNDGPVNGGQLTDLSVGVNWYLTPYTRITTNYIRAFAQSPGGIHSNTDIFGSRLQYDF